MSVGLSARAGGVSPVSPRIVLQSLAIISALAILALAIYAGYVALLLVALLGGFAAVVTIRWPMPALLLGLILTARPLDFFGLPQPALLRGGGLEVNLLDAVVLLTGAIGAAALWRRGEWPIFWWPLVFLGAAIVLSWVAGTIAGTTDIATGLNGIRPLLPYLLYFAGCGIVDSRAKLRALALLPLGCVAVAVPFQVWNFLTITPTADNRIVVGGVSVLYRSLILTDFVLVGAVFAFALLTAVDRHRARLVVLGVLGLAMGGIALKFTRQYYVFVVVGCAAAFLLSLGRDRLRSARTLLLLPAILLPVLLVANAWLAPRLGNSLFTVMALRGAEILRPQESENALVRVESTRRMWQRIEDAPLFGTGPNQVLGNDLSGEFYFTDLGFQSTLFFYGAAGLLGALGVAAALALRAWRTLRTAGDRVLRALLLGSLGALAGILACYGFAQDFFTFTLVPIVFILIIVDRAHRFSAAPGVPAPPAQAVTR